MPLTKIVQLVVLCIATRHPFSHGRTPMRLHVYHATPQVIAAYWCKVSLNLPRQCFEYIPIHHCEICWDAAGRTSPSQPGLLCQITCDLCVSILCVVSLLFHLIGLKGSVQLVCVMQSLARVLIAQDAAMLWIKGQCLLAALLVAFDVPIKRYIAVQVNPLTATIL